MKTKFWTFTVPLGILLALAALVILYNPHFLSNFSPWASCPGCPVPENGIVVVNPGAAAEEQGPRWAYDTEVTDLTKQFKDGDTAPQTLAYYSENVDDLSSRYFFSQDTDFIRALDEFNTQKSAFLKA